MNIALVDRFGLSRAVGGLLGISFDLRRFGLRLELLRYFLSDFDSEYSLPFVRQGSPKNTPCLESWAGG